MILNLLRKIIPLNTKIVLKKILKLENKNQNAKDFLASRFEILNNILNGLKLNCVDVGSANGLQPHWVRMYDNIKLLAFEPHPKSYAEVLEFFRDKITAGDFKVLPIGLSDTGGKRILYSTNVPTGSSLLEPDTSLETVSKSSYFLPIKEIEINTLSLTEAIQTEKFPLPDIIKLDIQGLEYDVISSFSKEIKRNLLLIEVEINFTTVYKGQKDLIQYLQLHKDMDFELLDLRTNRGSQGDINFYKNSLGDLAPYDPSVAQRVYEVDAIFIKKYSFLLAEKNPDRIRRCISILCVYNFFNEALSILKQSFELNIFTKDEFEFLRLKIREMNQWMQSELTAERNFLKSKDGIVWAQYMNVPYPSF